MTPENKDQDLGKTENNQQQEPQTRIPPTDARPDTVIVDVCGDSGPYASYWLSERQTPKKAPPGSHGFGTVSFRAPRGLWEEYDRLKSRIDEIETEFSNLETLTDA